MEMENEAKEQKQNIWINLFNYEHKWKKLLYFLFDTLKCNKKKQLFFATYALKKSFAFLKWQFFLKK